MAIVKQHTLFGDPPRSVNKVYEKVVYVLTNYPTARGNDKELIWRVWTIFDGADEILPDDVRERFERWLLSDAATTPETIRRSRQSLQEHDRYLPDEGTHQARHEEEKKYRRFFGTDGEETYG